MAKKEILQVVFLHTDMHCNKPGFFSVSFVK